MKSLGARKREYKEKEIEDLRQKITEKESEERKVRIKNELKGVRKALEVFSKDRWGYLFYKYIDAAEMDYEKVLEQAIVQSLYDAFVKEDIAFKDQKEGEELNESKQILKAMQEDFSVVQVNDEEEELRKEIISAFGALKMVQSEDQIDQSMKAIRYLQNNQNFAIIGSLCDGKTTLIRIASNVFLRKEKILFKTAMVNASLYSYSEVFGNPNYSWEVESQNDVKKFNLLQIIDDGFTQDQQPSEFISQKKSILIRMNQGEQADMYQQLIDINVTNDQDVQFKNKDSIIASNGNKILMENQVSFIFMMNDMYQVSPRIAAMNLIVIPQENVTWENLFTRKRELILNENKGFLESHGLGGEIFERAYNMIIHPFLTKLQANKRLTEWPLWDMKRLTVSFFNFLDSMIKKLQMVYTELKQREDPVYLNLEERGEDVVYNMCLISVVWSFGGVLNAELRKVFEDNFAAFKRLYNLNIGTQSRISNAKLSIFDIYFDFEKLEFDLLVEKLEYKLKMHYDAAERNLMIPTLEISQAYHAMDHLMTNDTNFLLYGSTATQKTTILNSFATKNQDTIRSIKIPMSSYLSLPKLQAFVEQYYVHKRKNRMQEMDWKKNLFMIDDVHLQENFSNDIVSYFDNWSSIKGFYDFKNGLFKHVHEVRVVMAQTKGFKQADRMHKDKRGVYYATTIYCEEFNNEKIKLFTQHWLTSKMWNTSNLINKYYILLTNSLIHLVDKLKKHENLHQFQLNKLGNFHNISALCHNLTQFTLLTETFEERNDPLFRKPQGARHALGNKRERREEDLMAEVFCYEIQRRITDRIMMPKERLEILNKIQEVCRTEFLATNLSAENIEEMLMGNYHELKKNAHVKYINTTLSISEIRKKLKQKVREESNNNYLEALLDSNQIIRDIYKISRMFYKEQMHYLMLGKNGLCKREILQQATLLNNAIVFEPDCDKFQDSQKFIKCFHDALISCIKTAKPVVFLIDDNHVCDLTYIDFINSFIQNPSINLSISSIVDPKIKDDLIEIERQEYMKDEINAKFAKSNDDGDQDGKSVSRELLLQNVNHKIVKYLHIALNVNHLENYYEWVQTFPHIETHFEVIYIDDLTNEGYVKLTQEYLVHRDIDEELLRNNVMAKELVYFRNQVKNRVIDNHCNKSLMEFYHKSEFNQQMQEVLLNDEIGGSMTGSRFFENLLADELKQNMDKYSNRQENQVKLEYSSKFRYVLFIELVRFFFDMQVLILNFLSQTATLMVKKNFYDSYCKKADEFRDYFQQLKQDKKTLYSKNTEFQLQILQLNEMIRKTENLITDKEGSIKRRQKEIGDNSAELGALNDELGGVVSEKDMKLAAIIEEYEELPKTEFTYIQQNSKFPDSEIRLLDIMMVLILIQDKGKNKVSEIKPYFEVREELHQYLVQRKDYEYNDSVLARVKHFINTYTLQDFERTLFKVLFRYIMELYRKLNVRNTMNSTIQKINELKDNVKSAKLSITYAQKAIKEGQEQLQQLRSKMDQMKDKEGYLSKQIESTEIQHVRTAQIIESILDSSDQAKRKFTKIQKRIRFLLGDCMMFAASIAYMGVFNLETRVSLRNKLADNLNYIRIDASQNWLESDPVKHNKLFKEIIKEYGLGSILHKLKNADDVGIFSEAIFCLLFAPSTPVVNDTIGNFQTFIRDVLKEEIEVRTVFASDYLIQNQMDAVFSSRSLCFLNDLNNFSRPIFGKTQDKGILNRLAQNMSNGIDYNYPKQFLSDPSGQISYVNSFQENKKIPLDNFGSKACSLHQITVFTNHMKFALNDEFLSRATIINTSEINDKHAWIDVYEIFLKIFQPNSHIQLEITNKTIHKILNKKQDLRRNFENLFLVTDRETLFNIGEFEALKDAVNEIKLQEEELGNYQAAKTQLINEHPLLASYANILVIMFNAMVSLRKLTDENVYTWQIFLQMIEMIVSKIVRDLHQNYKKKQEAEEEDQDPDDSDSASVAEAKKRKKEERDKEFTIDEDFFHTVVMPSIHSTVISSLKQEHISMFNLLFAIEIALRKRSIQATDRDFLIENLIQFKGYLNWRKNDFKFIELTDQIEKSRYFSLKRELIKLYPEERSMFEKIEQIGGNTYKYKDISLLVYKKLFMGEFQNISLIKKINLGFVCPDDEFRSKICQFVYEELSLIFDFSEDLVKLHNFIKTASWQLPIALFTTNSINIVNTICSIASYYGVGLEVLRTDSNDILQLKKQNQPKHEATQNIRQASLGTEPEKDEIQQRDIASLQYYPNSIKPNLTISQQVYKRSIFSKDDLEIEDKQQDQNCLQLIEQCATNGTWVLVSTLKFPTYWSKVSQLLAQLRADGKIMNTFRIFFDLQGYQRGEISETFMTDNCVKFFLTDQNNEDMEGFNDVWANILNDEILTDQELKNMPILEPKSELNKISMQLESNILDTSQMSQLLPGDENNKKLFEQYMKYDMKQEEGTVQEQDLSEIIREGSRIQSVNHSVIEDNTLLQDLKDQIGVDQSVEGGAAAAEPAHSSVIQEEEEPKQTTLDQVSQD